MFDAHARSLIFDEPDTIVVEPAPPIALIRAPTDWPDSSRPEEPMHICILTPDGVETWHRVVAGERDLTACEIRYLDARAAKIDATSSAPIGVRLRLESYASRGEPGERMCTRGCFTKFELRAGRVADAHAEGNASSEETPTEEMARIRRTTLEMPPMSVPPRKDPTR